MNKESSELTPELSATSAAQRPDSAVFGKLWTVPDVARFLRRSARWVFYALQTRPDQPGSIPHVKLGRSPRFIPSDLKAWAAAGFPPAATFLSWKEADRKRRVTA